MSQTLICSFNKVAKIKDGALKINFHYSDEEKLLHLSLLHPLYLYLYILK